MAIKSLGTLPFASTNHDSLNGQSTSLSILQLIQPKTIDLSTRPREITTEFVGIITWSLLLRSIVLGWILIYRKQIGLVTKQSQTFYAVRPGNCQQIDNRPDVRTETGHWPVQAAIIYVWSSAHEIKAVPKPKFSAEAHKTFRVWTQPQSAQLRLLFKYLIRPKGFSFRCMGIYLCIKY